MLIDFFFFSRHMNQVLGHLSNVVCGFHLIEWSISPIKIELVIYSHNTYSTIVPVYLAHSLLFYVTVFATIGLQFYPAKNVPVAGPK